jgi:hypothetical protein
MRFIAIVVDLTLFLAVQVLNSDVLAMSKWPFLKQTLPVFQMAKTSDWHLWFR